MRKQWKKIISVGCATCLLVSCIPETGIVLAAETETGVEIQSEEAVTSGTWGTCEWNLDEDGVLTISGGIAESLGENGTPWGNDFYTKINAVKITGNITFNKDNISLKYLFGGLGKMKKIEGLEKIDTSKVIDMSSMFDNCGELEELDVSGFDTSNVTNMDSMFYWCSGLKELDVSGFDTRNVTSMDNMFLECSELRKLDVSGFDTSNVTSMSSMFYGCSELKELDVSGFDTRNVTSRL